MEICSSSSRKKKIPPPRNNANSFFYSRFMGGIREHWHGIGTGIFFLIEEGNRAPVSKATYHGIGGGALSSDWDCDTPGLLQCPLMSRGRLPVWLGCDQVLRIEYSWWHCSNCASRVDQTRPITLALCLFVNGAFYCLQSDSRWLSGTVIFVLAAQTQEW